MADEVAVEEYAGVAESAVEFQPETFVPVLRRQVEGAAIPADAVVGIAGANGFETVALSAAGSKGNSTTQSCGRLRERQALSLNPIAAGPVLWPALSRRSPVPQLSPKWNFQPASIRSRWRGESAAEAGNAKSKMFTT
jgi:hypothetical protein